MQSRSNADRFEIQLESNEYPKLIHCSAPCVLLDAALCEFDRGQQLISILESVFDRSECGI